MSLANSEDQNEELHNAAFHQGLHSHCFLRQKQSLEKEIQNYGRLVVLLNVVTFKSYNTCTKKCI